MDALSFGHKKIRVDREWYRGFRQDCPDGQLTKKVIIEMCNQILPGGDSSTFVDQIFRIFDKDNNGTIDFKEFMIATDMTSSGSPEEKLEWAFKVRKYFHSHPLSLLVVFV